MAVPQAATVQTCQPITHARITVGVVCTQTCCTCREGLHIAGNFMAGNCRGGGFFFHVGTSTALAYIMRSTGNFARAELRVSPSGLEKHSVCGVAF